MKIGPLLIMIVAIATIMIAPAAAGAIIGALIALILNMDVIPVALIGALGGTYSGLAFLLNAGLNGKKGQGLQ